MYFELYQLWISECPRRLICSIALTVRDGTTYRPSSSNGKEIPVSFPELEKEVGPFFSNATHVTSSSPAVLEFRAGATVRVG